MNLNDDTEFRDVINSLKQLQQVNAPRSFEADLMRRINSEKYTERRSLLQNIFMPSRVVPAAALAITVVLLIIVLNNSGITRENPFSIIPRHRNDASLNVVKRDNFAPAAQNELSRKVSTPEGNGGIQKDEAVRNEPVQISKQKENSSNNSVKGEIAGNKSTDDKYINIRFASGRISDYPVSKAGLNFRQVNLSNQQKNELNQLKEKLDLMFRNKMK